MRLKGTSAMKIKYKQYRPQAALAAILFFSAVFFGGCGQDKDKTESSLPDVTIKTYSSERPDNDINSVESREAVNNGQINAAVSIAEEFEGAGRAVPELEAYGENGVMIDGVPYINQLDNYPNGCECVSAVMLLNYWKINISVDAFIDNYLNIDMAPYYEENSDVMIGGNPRSAFLGDPRSYEAWGCDAPPIASAMKQAAPNMTIEELYNKTMDELCREYIDFGIPVLVWATVDMEEPTVSAWWMTNDGEEVQWVYPNHALVLTGYDDEYYYFNDPLRSAGAAYYKEDVQAAYQGNGMQAIVII